MSATSAYVVARPNLLRVFQYWPGPFTSQKGIAAFIKTTVLLDGSQDILRIVVLTFIEPQNWSLITDKLFSVYLKLKCG